jgi:hypothetical protein
VQVIALISPGFSVDGLARQLTVGGSNSFTLKPVEHSAFSPGFNPSLPFLPSFTSAYTE